MKERPLLTSPLCSLSEMEGTRAKCLADGHLCCACENAGMRRMRPEGLRGLTGEGAALGGDDVADN